MAKYKTVKEDIQWCPVMGCCYYDYGCHVWLSFQVRSKWKMLFVSYWAFSERALRRRAWCWSERKSGGSTIFQKLQFFRKLHENENFRLRDLPLKKWCQILIFQIKRYMGWRDCVCVGGGGGKMLKYVLPQNVICFTLKHHIGHDRGKT